MTGDIEVQRIAKPFTCGNRTLGPGYIIMEHIFPALEPGVLIWISMVTCLFELTGQSRVKKHPETLNQSLGIVIQRVKLTLHPLQSSLQEAHVLEGTENNGVIVKFFQTIFLVFSLSLLSLMFPGKLIVG